MVLAHADEQNKTFLNSCLVEGDSEYEQRARRMRRRALAISIILQILAVTALLLYPLLGRSERISLRDATPVPPYARLGSRNPHTPTRPHTPTNHPVCSFCFSGHIPPTIVTHDPTPAQSTTDDSVDDSEISRYGDPNGDRNGVLNSNRTQVPKPPDDRDSHVGQPTVRQRISETVQTAQLIHRVEPVYPALARQLGRSGRVELHAIIGTNGTIQALEVISGDPLLIRSAREAVQEWRYRATILNGQPVEVDTYITVIYTLNRGE